MFKVYLVGPITGCTPAEAFGWREQIQYDFGHLLDVLNPLSGKDHIKEEETIKDEYSGLLTSPKAVITRDLFFVRQADIIFANFSYGSKVSVGSLVEIGVAVERNIPIIVALGNNPFYASSMFLSQLCYCLPTYKEAYEVLCGYV